MKGLFPAVVCALIFNTMPCVAQRDSVVVIKPKYVLVQLSSESNRVNALTKNGRNRDAQMVEKDAEFARAAMVKDFKDHFTYCPVFFYIDTNVQLVKDRHFAGILTDTSENVVVNPPVNEQSKDYLITYFGLPMTRQRQYNAADSVEQYSKIGEPNGKGLIICNYKLQQLTYFYRLGGATIAIGSDPKRKPYFYESKHFDIEYYPLAEKFNKNVPATY